MSHISDESILQLVGFFGNLIDALQRLQPFALADGNDYHDWFEELRKFLGIDGKMLVRNFYRIMQEMDKEIEEFIAELKKSIA